METKKTFWFILGGIGLVVIGLLVGFALGGRWGAIRTSGTVDHGPMMWDWDDRWGGHMMRPSSGSMVSHWGTAGVFPGAVWPLMILFLLGPLPGIVALIILLARHPASQSQLPKPPEPSEPTEE